MGIVCCSMCPFYNNWLYNNISAVPVLITPSIELFPAGGYAILRLSITEGQVTHILVRACEIRVGECIDSNITGASATRRRRDIPTNVPVEARVDIPANGEEYSFQLTLYDGQDVVVSPELIKKRSSSGLGNV